MQRKLGNSFDQRSSPGMDSDDLRYQAGHVVSKNYIHIAQEVFNFLPNLSAKLQSWILSHGGINIHKRTSKDLEFRVFFLTYAIVANSAVGGTWRFVQQARGTPATNYFFSIDSFAYIRFNSLWMPYRRVQLHKCFNLTSCRSRNYSRVSEGTV